MAAASRVVVRSISEADFPAVNRVLQAAYGRTTNFIPQLRWYTELEPEGWYLAESGRQVIGSVGVTTYGAFAYLGLMSVRPDRQRQGVGRQLLSHVLAWLDARGCSSVRLDATEAGALLYRQFGFRHVASARQFELRGRPRLGRATTGLEPLTRRSWREIAAFDAPRFGGDRTRVLRTLLEDYAPRGWLVRSRAGELRGYLVAREAILGPCVTQDIRAAGRLFRAALRLPFDHGPVVLVPRGNRQAAHLLTELGLTGTRRLRHMHRGPQLAQQAPQCLFAQTSFALG